jgi:hypothetical protein
MTSDFSKEFTKALLGEDELGVIIRSHIYIESEIDEYLRLALRDYAQLGRLEYSTKVRIALACGLRKELKGPLNALGSLRNKFAHELGKAITASVAGDFYSTFGKAEKEAIARAMTSAPKHQMVVCLVTLWAALFDERNFWEPKIDLFSP